MPVELDAEVCQTTGRILTEWFEHPELTDEEIEHRAFEKAGVDGWPDLEGKGMNSGTEAAYLTRKINGFIQSRKRRKWRNGMTKQEVQWRMNEATKMVSPDNFKFLPESIRERTGLEVNPLWMMECLVRSGLLSPKEQITALTNLATYTHSKAPTVNQNANINMTPEEWLLELAKEEYKEVEVKDHDIMQLREKGAGLEYETRRKSRAEVQNNILIHQVTKLSEMEKDLEDWVDPYE